MGTIASLKGLVRLASDEIEVMMLVHQLHMSWNFEYYLKAIRR